MSIDETSIYINMTRNRGRNTKGRRVYYNTNVYPYKKYNLLCAIKYGKVVGMTLYKETGGINKEKFISFINKAIENKYNNHLILLDNAIFHRSKEVRKTIEETGNVYLYSVRYRPNTNFIEGFFNQLKHYIKLKSPQTYDEIVDCIKYILSKKIKKEHLENYAKYLFLRGSEYIKKYKK